MHLGTRVKMQLATSGGSYKPRRPGSPELARITPIDWQTAWSCMNVLAVALRLNHLSLTTLTWPVRSASGSRRDLWQASYVTERTVSQLGFNGGRAMRVTLHLRSV